MKCAKKWNTNGKLLRPTFVIQIFLNYVGNHSCIDMSISHISHNSVKYLRFAIQFAHVGRLFLIFIVTKVYLILLMYSYFKQ